MKITKVGRYRWQVLSDSGNTYDVGRWPKMDILGSMYLRWECSCPSRQRPCKHVRAVVADTEAADAQAAERIQ